jgi:hypothetical protein
MIKNWNRKTDWTDYQTAKFRSLINGDHKLCNDNERLAQRTVGCPAHQLRRILSKLSGKTYVYPLQRWVVEHPYSLFEISTNVAYYCYYYNFLFPYYITFPVTFPALSLSFKY